MSRSNGARCERLEMRLTSGELGNVKRLAATLGTNLTGAILWAVEQAAALDGVWECEPFPAEGGTGQKVGP